MSPLQPLETIYHLFQCTGEPGNGHTLPSVPYSALFEKENNNNKTPLRTQARAKLLMQLLKQMKVIKHVVA